MNRKPKAVKSATDTHLSNATKILIKGFKTPANLVSFFGDALRWIDRQGVAKEQWTESVFFISMFISNVGTSWVEGKDLSEKLPKALYQIFSWGGTEYYMASMEIIINGFTTSCLEGAYVDDYLDMIFEEIKVLIQVGHELDQIELDRMINKLEVA